MQIEVTSKTVSKFSKRTYKFLKQYASDIKLSEAQEGLAKILGYKNYHDLNKKVTIDKPKIIKENIKELTFSDLVNNLGQALEWFNSYVKEIKVINYGCIEIILNSYVSNLAPESYIAEDGNITIKREGISLIIDFFAHPIVYDTTELASDIIIAVNRINNYINNEPIHLLNGSDSLRKMLYKMETEKLEYDLKINPYIDIIGMINGVKFDQKIENPFKSRSNPLDIFLTIPKEIIDYASNKNNIIMITHEISENAIVNMYLRPKMKLRDNVFYSMLDYGIRSTLSQKYLL